MKQNRVFMKLVLYLFGFLLLWEWLLPLEQITQTSQVHYFIFFVVFSIILIFLHTPLVISWPAKTAFILISLYLIFREPNEPVIFWFIHLGSEIKLNMALIASRNWIGLSPEFRSLLFFLLLWQITYLLRFWLTVRKKIFVFYVMTVFYVTLLDTFTEYEANRAIVRVVIIGFALLGILFFQRLLDKEQFNGQSQLMKKWTFPLTAMIAICVLAGYISPKAAPVWPDPVPYIESKAGKTANTGISKIGYGIDDSQLGGPFLSDDRVVFEVASSSRQYWKIETKDVYTGKGWITSEQSAPLEQFKFGETFITDEHLRNEGNLTKASFRFEIVYPHIVRPYGFMSVTGDETGGFLQYDPVLGKISSFTSDGREMPLKEYTITYEKSNYSMKELRGTSGLPEGEKYERIQKRYTQLPTSFPERIRELAVEITKEEHNWFDKAKAIERHFQAGEFTYDQTRVAIPTGDEDYVEQFLFDTKRGYCDNFSTSMVTMLRSIGIPARWAKGYAPGNYREAADGEYRIYEVTNNEAHSWVEVYFPTMGWVPFEPTKGFNNPSSYVFDEMQTQSNQANPAEPSEKEVEKKKEEKEINKEKDSTKASVITGNGLFPWIWGGALLLAVLAPGFLIFFRKRKRLFSSPKENNDIGTFIEAYDILLKCLDQRGLKRKTGQTLREYAAYIDRQFQTKEMSQLTQAYERIIYRGDDASILSSQEKELWEMLMKKAGGRP